MSATQDILAWQRYNDRSMANLFQPIRDHGERQYQLGQKENARRQRLVDEGFLLPEQADDPRAIAAAAAKRGEVNRFADPDQVYTRDETARVRDAVAERRRLGYWNPELTADEAGLTQSYGMEGDVVGRNRAFLDPETSYLRTRGDKAADLEEQRTIDAEKLAEERAYKERMAEQKRQLEQIDAAIAAGYLLPEEANDPAAVATAFQAMQADQATIRDYNMPDSMEGRADEIAQRTLENQAYLTNLAADIDQQVNDRSAMETFRVINERLGEYAAKIGPNTPPEQIGNAVQAGVKARFEALSKEGLTALFGDKNIRFEDLSYEQRLSLIGLDGETLQAEVAQRMTPLLRKQAGVLQFQRLSPDVLGRMSPEQIGQYLETNPSGVNLFADPSAGAPSSAGMGQAGGGLPEDGGLSVIGNTFGVEDMTPVEERPPAPPPEVTPLPRGEDQFARYGADYAGGGNSANTPGSAMNPFIDPSQAGDDLLSWPRRRSFILTDAYPEGADRIPQNKLSVEERHAQQASDNGQAFMQQAEERLSAVPEALKLKALEDMRARIDELKAKGVRVEVPEWWWQTMAAGGQGIPVNRGQSFVDPNLF